MRAGTGDCPCDFSMLTAGMNFLQGPSVSKYLLSLATPESEIQWHTVSEVAASLDVSVDEVRNRLSAMNRSLLGYAVVVGQCTQA